MKSKSLVSDCHKRPVALFRNCKRLRFGFYGITKSKRIRIDISSDHLVLSVRTFDRISMFHSDHTVKTAGMDILKDISVIDFTGSGFFSPGIVTSLEVANFIPASFYVWDKISLGDLLMINVEQNFAGGAVDRFADRVGLRRTLQENPAVIRKPV